MYDKRSKGLVEYICGCCGSVNRSFDINGVLKQKYDTCSVYCSECREFTVSYNLGPDSTLVKSELMYSDCLSPIEEKILELFKKRRGRTR